MLSMDVLFDADMSIRDGRTLLCAPMIRNKNDSPPTRRSLEPASSLFLYPKPFSCQIEKSISCEVRRSLLLLDLLRSRTQQEHHGGNEAHISDDGFIYIKTISNRM